MSPDPARPIRALVVDDEPLARRKLVRMLRREPDVEVVGECADGREAVAAIGRSELDLIFLDVQMPELDGFGVVEEVGAEAMPAVVFVTAYDQHALRAFEVHALDYLLKPFAHERFQRTLERSREAIRSRRTGEEPIAPGAERLLAMLQEIGRPRQYLERFAVRVGNRVSFVRPEEVDRIESEGNYLRLFAGGHAHLVRGTMKELEGRLNPERFLRVHRSHVVNLDHIREVRPAGRGEYTIVFRDHTQVTTGWGYAEGVRKLLQNPL